MLQAAWCQQSRAQAEKIWLKAESFHVDISELQQLLVMVLAVDDLVPPFV